MVFIQNLRNKSDKQKNKILIITLVIFMLAVVGVWFFQMKGYVWSKNNLQLEVLTGAKNDVVSAYGESIEKIRSIKDRLNFNEI